MRQQKSHIRLSVFGYLQVFMWEAPAEVATVEQLDQFYILCPVNVKDSYLVQTVRMFQEKNEKGSIMIFTDTCKYEGEKYFIISQVIFLPN
jgi:hypothetical protein